jgi:hypothetical protein
MTLKIIGAGLAGLLAGNMLRQRNPVILETQPELPNNHSAVLRFRTSAVGDVLNLPFRKVTMIKAHVPGPNLVCDALQYSYKNTAMYRSDRSINAGMVTADRWIAPNDLIPRMAANCRISYNTSFKLDTTEDPVISTMPMQALMKLLRYPAEDSMEFSAAPGVNITAKIQNCDAYISLLVPHPSFAFSRISITGDQMIIECPHDNKGIDRTTYMIVDSIIGEACVLLGINREFASNITSHKARYAKINPIDDDARKAFMHWATVNHNIYSLGRFATWRPGLLLDDLVQDVRKIDGWINKCNKYDLARVQ